MTQLRNWRVLLLGGIILAAACVTAHAGEKSKEMSQDPPSGLEKATFAGGCFWCMQPPFDKLDGVVSTTAGYTGGHVENPTYDQVSSGGTGHAEAVEILYDPKKIGYEKLLEVFWHNVDPTDANGQFCDYGDQYRSEIFYHDAEQKRLAEKSKAELERTKPFKDPIVTRITRASTFYPAEEYHQSYYKNNPIRYKIYRYNCGRDARLNQLWVWGGLK